MYTKFAPQVRGQVPNVVKFKCQVRGQVPNVSSTRRSSNVKYQIRQVREKVQMSSTQLKNVKLEKNYTSGTKS